MPTLYDRHVSVEVHDADCPFLKHRVGLCFCDAEEEFDVWVPPGGPYVPYRLICSSRLH